MQVFIFKDKNNMSVDKTLTHNQECMDGAILIRQALSCVKKSVTRCFERDHPKYYSATRGIYINAV